MEPTWGPEDDSLQERLTKQLITKADKLGDALEAHEVSGDPRDVYV